MNFMKFATRSPGKLHIPAIGNSASRIIQPDSGAEKHQRDVEFLVT